jgi:hypothetical protein
VCTCVYLPIGFPGVIEHWVCGQPEVGIVQSSCCDNSQAVDAPLGVLLVGSGFRTRQTSLHIHDISFFVYLHQGGWSEGRKAASYLHVVDLDSRCCSSCV